MGFRRWCRAGVEVTQCQDQAVAVWRQGTTPRFRAMHVTEYHALEIIAQGNTLGDLAKFCDANLLGQWLAQWLSDGIFSKASPAATPL